MILAGFLSHHAKRESEWRCLATIKYDLTVLAISYVTILISRVPSSYNNRRLPTEAENVIQAAVLLCPQREKETNIEENLLLRGG